MFNRTTGFIIVAALAAGLGLLASKAFFSGRDDGTQLAMQTVKLFPQPRALPAFALRQSDGTQLALGELAGHWTVVFLGFTHCPDICPTTLAELAQAQKRWAALPDSTRPRVLFVSVDPDRDTPMKTGEYARAFHRDTLAATADVPALESFAKSMSMVFVRVPSEAGEPEAGTPADRYSVDHSASLAVLDPQGRMAGVITPPLLPKAIADDLIALTSAK
ncbi:MAG: SCO family protein [Pseudomonadota bacterium]|nr:SCO family protein [Pseudomonadota bacterium]